MRKLNYVTFIAIIATSISFAQEVKIEKDKVLIDNKEVLKYEKIDLFTHSFFTLEGDEILLYKYNNNETTQYADDDYIVLNFLMQKKKVESKSWNRAIAGIGLSSKKNMEKLVSWLLKEKVIDTNGVLNADKVEVFDQKYNDNLSERTIR